MDTSQLEPLISKCLKDFYERRIQTVAQLKLPKVLQRKNPYLFRALGTQKASEIVDRLASDYISASDESLFGDAFFEPIARIASGGNVSDAAGVDFVVETENRVTSVAMKSGPNPYNSSQKKRQHDEFLAVRSRLYKMHKEFDPVLGHGYGRKNSPNKSQIYRDSSGQVFWQEMTGDPDFYLKLIRLMKDEPAKHREAYQPAWDATINRFTAEFIKDFCFPDGSIDWEKLVQFVSAEKRPRRVKGALVM
ncbi:MAG: hypothetical protein HW388_1367 [Dehalococcoidia bacterium]|nr:hypothetical protein [Dehalococcoidia bacterium]